MDFSGIKVGDKAKSVLRGWGEISVVRDESFAVDFGEPRNWDWFWNDGKKRKSDIKPEIVNWERKKWKPTGGKYILSGSGEIFTVSNLSLKMHVQFDRTFKTYEQAEIAEKLFNTYQRQLSWIFDNYPEYDPFNEKYNFVVTHNSLDEWSAVFAPTIYGNELRMTEHIARELAEKLNSGEVEL